MSENFSGRSLSSLGKKISRVPPKNVESRQRMAPSVSVTKYRRTSSGAAMGWPLAMRVRQEWGRDPSENATLANRAVDTGIESARRIRNISMMRLDAPIMLTGLEALSVETQKYFFARIS